MPTPGPFGALLNISALYDIIRIKIVTVCLLFAEKMSRQMSGEDNVLRTKILKEINEDFHQGDKLNFAMASSEILFELVNCFEE